MSDPLLDAPGAAQVPVEALTEAAAAAYLKTATPFVAGLAAVAEFKGKAGQILVAPGPDGRPERALFGLGADPDAQALRGLAARLPPGEWRLVSSGLDVQDAAVAFALGAYRFDRFKPRNGGRPRLFVNGADLGAARAVAHACALARDMINTPASDMGPLQIETIAREIAEQYGAQITVTIGEGLIEAGYPAIHAVGRAAAPDRAP